VILFWLLAVALLATAVYVITAPKPVYSVVALLANFVVLAIMYLSLSAEFIAITQILVYTGAILILFLFVIALLTSGNITVALGPDRLPKISTPALFAIILTLIAIGYGAAHAFGHIVPIPSPHPELQVGAAGAFGSVADFGATLFTQQLLPFELTALILMIAVIGVVVLAGDHEALTQTDPRKLAKLRRLEREAILREGEPR
jgi:NADH-quinone oxidoreductase subunit J